MERYLKTHSLNPSSGIPLEFSGASEEAVPWLERTLPHIMQRLMDSENLDMPLLQLPLAQLRLAHALYKEPRPDSETGEIAQDAGDTMGQLSDRLGVRHNALTQVADRLINHGLAERIGDPTDRRIVRLRLTPQGREWVQARRQRRRAHLTALWAQLDPEDRARFVLAVRTLEEIGRQLEPERPAPQVATQLLPAQTVEETLTRFIAGIDTMPGSSPTMSGANKDVGIETNTAEPAINPT
jgi:DNA-binding MarR family transcriptional regulator